MTSSLPRFISEPFSFATHSSARIPKNRSATDLQPGCWVHLLELPSPFSFDEALLLCQCAEDHWLVWIPDHGEMTLKTHQFCSIDLSGN
jgi:hypothetical protein